MVSCGHHPPLLHHDGDLWPLADRAASLPLGLEDDFTSFATSWRPGDRLLLYTDGLVESRNQHGDFLPQDQIATALLAADGEQALDMLMSAVHRHTGGHSHNIAWWTFRSSPQPMTSPDGTWAAPRRKSGPNGREPRESARPALHPA